MGIATLFVLICSSFLISVFKNMIPDAVRISAYVLIIATFVSIVEMVMQAVVPEIHHALGAFVYLIVVNCMILARQEAFASRQPPFRSVLDSLGTSLGFLLALFLMGAVREIIGAGAFLGYELFGEAYEPWVVMVLPPGGFFTIGIILLVLNWLQLTRSQSSTVRRWPNPVAERRVA